MAVTVGQAAPELELYSDEKELLKLSNYKGTHNVLLLFYPGAFTGVCTNELNMVNNDLADFGADTQVLGISTDSPFAQAEFKKVNALTFPLLSDHNAVASVAYGCKYNHDFTPMKLDRISKRSAFVVGKDGLVKYAEVLENAGELPDLDAVKGVLSGL